MSPNQTGLITVDDGTELQLASAWVACEYIAFMLEIDSLDDTPTARVCQCDVTDTVVGTK